MSGYMTNRVCCGFQKKQKGRSKRITYEDGNLDEYIICKHEIDIFYVKTGHVILFLKNFNRQSCVPTSLYLEKKKGPRKVWNFAKFYFASAIKIYKNRFFCI